MDNNYAKTVLASYLKETNVEHKTTQDIIDALKDIYPLDIKEVAEYLIDNGYELTMSEEIPEWREMKV